MSPELSSGYADGARSLLKTRSSCCATPRLVMPRVTIDALIVFGAVTFHSLSTTAGLPDGADEGAAADAAGVDGCDDGSAAESDLAGRSADGAWTAALVHAERTMATKTDRAASRERSMMFTRQVSKRFSRERSVRSFPTSSTPQDVHVIVVADRVHAGCRRSRTVRSDEPRDACRMALFDAGLVT